MLTLLAPCLPCVPRLPCGLCFSAAKLFPNDWYRLHRAVVVALQGGETPPEEASLEVREMPTRHNAMMVTPTVTVTIVYG